MSIETHIVAPVIMDTPMRQVSWLESFPTDIWACIVCYLHGEQLGRLIMTGSTLISHLLKSRHVVKSIKLGSDFIVFKSFPRFLYDFQSIEDLVIHSPYNDWSRNLCLSFGSIPSGVRKLELNGCWSESALTQLEESVADLKRCDLLPRLESLLLSDLELGDDRWLTHTPRSLTFLSLHHWSGTVELPASLIDFYATNIEISAPSFVSKLPPQLASFRAQSMVGADLILPFLPPSTRALCFGGSGLADDHRTPHRFFEQLPQSLIELEVLSSPNITFTTNSELASLLPSSLTSLVISQEFPFNAWCLLPSQLRWLSLKAPDPPSFAVYSIINDDFGAAAFPFEALPRTVTRFELRFSGTRQYFCGAPVLSNSFSYFPPHLEFLSIPDIQLSEGAAKLLPSSLVYVKCGKLFERVCQHLPRGLKTLISSELSLSPNLFNVLPSSLTFFESSLGDSHTCMFDYNSGHSLQPVSATLEWTIHRWCLNRLNTRHLSSLPPTLTHLSLLHAEKLRDAFMLHQKLPNLLDLRLGSCTGFTDPLIPLLSRHLTALDLRNSSQITGKSFEFLPRGLNTLHLNNSHSIFDSDILQLPRDLKQLEINRAVHLTELCIPDLPPHLEWLNMDSNSQIPTSSFPNLPSPLRSSQFNASVLFANWSVYCGKLVIKKRGKNWCLAVLSKPIAKIAAFLHIGTAISPHTG